eukprot:scaffold23355_cov61-Isochrysis_galbana.AAC.1
MDGAPSPSKTAGPIPGSPGNGPRGLPMAGASLEIAALFPAESQMANLASADSPGRRCPPKIAAAIPGCA